MEVLKNLSEYELTNLRDRFSRTKDNAISLEEFEEALHDACIGKPYIKLQNLRLKELFSDIDINGDNTVSWDEFTMFLIDMATQNTSVLDDEGEENLKKYSHIHNIGAEEGEIPNSIVETRYLPKIDKVMKIMRRDKSSRLKICLPNHQLTTYLEVPKTNAISILSAEHVPLSNDVHRSGSIAVSYSDSVIRFFDLKKTPMAGGWSNDMPLARETRLLESQTVMRWSSVYNRMVLGSRSGMVSILDVDQPNVSSKEKLHDLVVLDMKLQDSQLFTASLDPNHSVKCVDLQRSVVKFSLNSHRQGATMIETDTRYNQLFTVGFELSAHVYSITMPRLKPYRLHDPSRPHKGRIIGLATVPESPQVLTADTFGLVKVWDLRTYSCVQSIFGATNEQEHQAVSGGGWTRSSRKKFGGGIDDVLSLTSTNQISSIGYIPALKSIIVNGRETNMFQYEDASCPHLSDDNSCNIALYNSISHTFLTVHNRTLQIWNAVTGSLRCRREDVVSSDITAVAMVYPLGRRFFAGTLDGNLYSIGYAMGTILRKFDRCYTSPRSEADFSSTPSVVDMMYLETFRETKSAYLLVGFSQEVILVPDAEEHVKKSSLSLHCFNVVLKGKNTSVTKVSTAKGCVIIGTTNGMIHVADMNNFSLIHSWGQQHLRGEVVSLDIVSIPTSTSSSFAFVADTSGMILAVLLESMNKWEVLHKWDATCHTRNQTVAPHTRGRGQISTEILKSMSSKEITYMTRSDNSGGEEVCAEEGDVVECFGSSKFNDGNVLKEVVQPSIGFHIAQEINSGCEHSFFNSEGLGTSIKIPPFVEGGKGAVTSYFNTTTNDALLPVVTEVVYLNSSRMVVSADDRGFISVWGVSKLVDRTYGEYLSEHVREGRQGELSPLVTLFAYWRAHDEEVTSLSILEKNGNTIILSSSNDKKVLLWSLDGVLLGNLAQGRSPNNQKGNINKHIHPFLIDSPPAAAWECFENYNHSLQDSLDPQMGSINTVKEDNTCISGENGDLKGDESLIFLTETKETSGVVPQADVNTVANSISPSLETFNFDETVNPNNEVGFDTMKTPLIKLPMRFKGLVNEAKTSDPKAKIGRPLKCREVSQPPLMHHTLPSLDQYKGSYCSPLRGSDGRQSLLPLAGGVSISQQPVHKCPHYGPPTQIPVAASTRDYVTQEMCANSKTVDNYSTINKSNHRYAGSNLIGQDCLRPSKPSESVIFASAACSAYNAPKKIGNPFANMPKSTHRNLISSIKRNPFETEIERDMRVNGNVVFGKLSTEASNRLLEKKN